MFKSILIAIVFGTVGCISDQSEKKKLSEDLKCPSVVDDRQREENIDIVIEHSLSYKYDLTRQTYTISNMNSDTTVHFSLSSLERKQIIDKYYDLCLNLMSGKERIEDNCEIMPKLYTSLKVKSKMIDQELIFDENCDEYDAMFESQGKRAVAFMEFVTKILASKPEIKNAPTSDIMYL